MVRGPRHPAWPWGYRSGGLGVAIDGPAGPAQAVTGPGSTAASPVTGSAGLGWIFSFGGLDVGQAPATGALWDGGGTIRTGWRGRMRGSWG